MNLARLYSAELEGIDARIIEVEADINVGLHQFNIVGLGDRSLTEARERVNSALKNSGVKPPARENRKITINLAPADIKKTGSHYDLAIAIGYLLASGQIKRFDTKNKIFLGELALDGRLRPVNGSLNIAQKAADAGFEFLFLPQENANEAAAIKTIKIIPIKNFRSIIEALEGRRDIMPEIFQPRFRDAISAPDFSEIKGQEAAKRALMIAAAGEHNIVMTGPPGVGKSFLAKSMRGIMPDLTIREAIETTKIWSAAGMIPDGLVFERPFRAPHQTTSAIALVGGGQEARPGEISMAHNGILFLDELPEFSQNTLEALRQPMESGIIQISRARGTVIFPSRFSLVASMNPCPCGYYGDDARECKCTAYEIIRYRKKVSGPLLDRIDIRIKLGRVKINQLKEEKGDALVNPGLKAEVEYARMLRSDRLKREELKRGHADNGSTMRSAYVLADLESGAEKFLGALDKNHFSPRGYLRLLKVARTIADLDNKQKTSAEHLAEAYSYRLRELD